MEIKKVIGFQVIEIKTGNLHPKMSGSFCIYSIPQCMSMLLKDKNKDLYTIETVMSGDIEEPTIMFNGRPQTAEVNLIISKKNKLL